MTNTLGDTLRGLLRPGAPANPALDTLVSAYATYHAVLAAVGGAFAAVLLVAAVVAFRRYRRAPRSNGFERRVLLWGAALGATTALLLAVVVAANLGNALNPRPGFAGSLPLLGTPTPGSARDRLQESFTSWLLSGDAREPSLVQDAVRRRLSWQRPKAVISWALLAVLAWASLRALTASIRASRAGRVGRRRTLLGAGVASAAACAVLVLVVLGNTQGAVAPLTMTLFYG